MSKYYRTIFNVQGSAFNTKSILLDGVDDFVTMGNASSLGFDRTDAFSISAWIKRSGIGVTDTIVSKMTNVSTDVGKGYLFFIASSNKLAMLMRTNNTSGNKLDIISQNTIADTNWHHVAVTYDGSGLVSGLELYIDGQLQTLVTRSGTLTTSITNTIGFNIGARDNTELFTAANIDEVSVYNSELSSSNITSIYGTGVPNDITSLSPLSWWRCGDGDTAPTLTDNGSGGNNGTMTNFSTFSTDVPT